MSVLRKKSNAILKKWHLTPFQQQGKTRQNTNSISISQKNKSLNLLYDNEKRQSYIQSWQTGQINVPPSVSRLHMSNSNLQFQRRLLRPAGLGAAQHEDGLQLVFILVEVDLE